MASLVNTDHRLLKNLIRAERDVQDTTKANMKSLAAAAAALSAWGAGEGGELMALTQRIGSSYQALSLAQRNLLASIQTQADFLGDIQQREERFAQLAKDREVRVNRLLKLTRQTKRVAREKSTVESRTEWAKKMDEAKDELADAEEALKLGVEEMQYFRTSVWGRATAMRMRAVEDVAEVWASVGQEGREVLESVGLGDQGEAFDEEEQEEEGEDGEPGEEDGQGQGEVDEEAEEGDEEADDEDDEDDQRHAATAAVASLSLSNAKPSRLE